ncbi:type IV pilin biogenesis protein [Acidithiobacillus sp.]|jgi:type IV pilus assembly protein PilY1|uniref:type IV pilin biogenesis protein n=1 Tax=Acidithiobacillus sp. TaxID=1872118 RepID=UPI0025B86CFE|nr:type IV pilin biogenesis protein [Acidithiobacillus sp.]MCK9188584.1 type IV pilin biogenesis protein [Acidithiobacillus sp.]MCK9360500.1 type IV pilin biogenesis protein [Acidithiobacillus sp.]
MNENARQKLIATAVCLSMTAAPLASWSNFAQANNTINILPANQPQVMILLDNSQGMAGVLQGPTGLSGAIMTGSGTVPENANSSSPANYTASGFTPPALGSSGTSVPYSVPCNTSGITAAAQSACTSVGASGSSSAYIDNSQSMLNVAEQAIGTIINTPEYSNNIQFGLMDYALSGKVSLYNTWVYYMSDNSGFSFGNSATGAPTGDATVANPCYQSGSNSCINLQQTVFGQGNGSISDPYLYVQASSDAPVINDVLYAIAAQWQPDATNAVGWGPNPYGLNLQNYMTGNSGVNFSNYSNGLASGMTPTSAGYFPLSQQVWESQRGYAFNASTSYNAGNIVSPISATNSTNATNIANAILPEVFRTDNSINYATKGPITASAGYSPVAGAFSTALSYYGKKPNYGGPPHTCGSRYVIFITDGQPTQGTGGNVYPPLGSASAQMFYGSTSITASNAGSSTSDPNNAVVETIQKIQTLYDTVGIKTYVLGVGSAVNPNVPGASAADQAVALQGQAVLTAMAQAGGTTNFYAATSASDVQSAMNSIIANILGKSVSASYGAPPSATVGSLEFLLKNINPITGQGDLYAYALQSNGTPSASPSWDANSFMSTGNRSSALYTTTPGGTNGAGIESSLTSVATNTPSAFGTLPTSLTAGTIAAYTINPSASGGAYLGGRQSGWYMGLPTSTPPQVLTAPNNGQLLGAGGITNSYLTFADTHFNRQNAVLFSDNDGFLYAMGYNNTGSPTLLWGWMPQGLLPQLQNYNTFWQGTSMQGGFQTIDATNGTNSAPWHTYVAGSAANGGILYDLQLTGTTEPNLKQTVWEDDLGGNYSQPQPSDPVFYQYQAPGTTNFGQTWALWAVNQAVSATSSTSYLIGVNVGTGQSFQDTLPFNNTATPYIDASGNLYLGDNTGNVYEISSATLPGLLTPGTATLTLANDFVNKTAIGNYSSVWSGSLSGSNPGEVQYIGGSYYQGKNYLRVQGPNGITIFSQLNGTWSPVWTAYAGGAGTWSSGAFTTQTSGANPPITALPAGSVVSAPALINSGAVILPVTVPPSANSCGNGDAYYYLYALNNGIFPSGTFTDSSGTAITTALFVGYGTAFTPTVTSFNGRTLLQGAASNTGPSKTFPTGFGAGLPLGGPTGWKLVN